MPGSTTEVPRVCATSSSLRLHDFSAEASGASYGSELDAQVLYTTPWKQDFGLKGAFYDADEFAADTDKIWVFTTWSI